MAEASVINQQRKLCFVLGIDYRSGTNHLYQLLRLHPQAVGLEPIWEDFLLHHSYRLDSYVQEVFRSWNPSWGVENKIATQSDLMRSFGKTLEQFLLLQVKYNSEKSGANRKDGALRFITKTPSVEGLDRFFTLFTDSIPIVLIRDGRSLVESGMRSFGWDFRQAAERWKHRAQIVLDFQKAMQGTCHRWFLVRFEDLVEKESEQLEVLFRNLGLDPGSYDYQQAKELKVIGGSETALQSGRMHWRSREKPQGFSPTQRFSHWTPEQHQDFESIAGEQLRGLGYL